MHKETITIKKIIHGGYGLGQLPSQQIVLTHFTLPGETITVTTEESNKNYLFGKVVEIEKNHLARTTPPCQYYGNCGGCNLQHCSYETQVLLKKDIVTDLLLHQKIIDATTIDSAVLDVIAAPSPFNYRQRIRLQVKSGGTLGFNRFRSNEIVEIKSCLLAQPTLNIALGAIQANDSARELLQLSTELELLQDPETDRVSCIFHFKRKPRPTDYKRAEKLLPQIQSIDRVFFSGKDFPMIGPIAAAETRLTKFLSLQYDTLDGLKNTLHLHWEVGGFCQVNLQQNKKMIETVLQFSKVTPQDTVLDLFCGMGNFAIPISQVAAAVDGFEGQGASIRCAKQNAVASGITNANFVKQPVHEGCKKLIEEKRAFDIVIIDPPRQGAPQLATQLKELCRKRLIYISCDPATLCRDLKDLMHNGFSVKTIQPIDMFPQTHHIETVAVLVPYSLKTAIKNR